MSFQREQAGSKTTQRRAPPLGTCSCLQGLLDRKLKFARDPVAFMSPICAMSPRLRILLNYDYFAKLECAYIRQDVRTTIIIIQTDRRTDYAQPSR